ncbi:PREDICTED: reverse mRNAase [Prunus dulcis]|uniref:PREDICTED: reverse mRNAase n=1 Tax=Prunus dulcis TaxID=3755 RepID=A0A5E4GHP7_PRUDU|nr:hypothetical protein L3X38_012334 [Prunus dulcis]VVA39387.1 PREDICTED: reverse mRNAase [Prunus dulcis]
MLKARYFPNSDFLVALSGSLPSFTWQSLLWGRDMLLLGFRWRIGDGRLVLIYGDPWVPYDRVFTVQFVHILLPTSRVCDLMTVSGSWDVGKVYETFSIPEARAILSIPLMVARGAVSWERRWFFLSFFEELETLMEIESATENPPPIMAGGSKHPPFQGGAVSALDYTGGCLQPLPCCERKHTVLWNERNGVLFSSQPTPPGTLVQRAKDYNDEFKRSSVANHRSLSSLVRDVKWMSPTDRWFKLNVGGAADMETRARGAGVIVCDFQGILVEALAVRAPSRIFVLATELQFLWLIVRRNALRLREVWWKGCVTFWPI